MGSAEPGPFDVRRTPYVVPFLRAANDPRYTEVVLGMGAQGAKTDNICNLMGWMLTDQPAPLVYFAPTKDFVEQVFEPRFMSMVDSSPVLSRRVERGKRQRLTMKRFGGIKVRLGWAGSASSLAGEPARKVFVDELDLMNIKSREHGDPLERAHARHSTYVDGQTIVTSTPTLGHAEVEQHPVTGLYHWRVAKPEDLESPIWIRWQEGTRHQWFVRCLSCATPFFPRLALMTYDEAVRPQDLKAVGLECPHCGNIHEEALKDELLSSGIALAPGQSVDSGGNVAGEVPAVRRWSMLVSGLCSPWRSWLTAMQRYLEARAARDGEREHSIVNMEFGELYSPLGEAPAWERVGDLRGGYEMGQVAADVRLLTCGVDVQKDRLIYSVRGWGVNFESWLVKHGELWGETEQDFVWTDLDKLLTSSFGGRAIRFTLIDSGYRPGEAWRRPDNQIYAFCRPRAGRVAASKGHDRQDKPYHSTRIDVTFGGRTIKAGLQLWHLDTDYFKTWLYARYEWPQDVSGAFHLPVDASDDYCQQITAEGRILAKGESRATWQRLRKQNHYLDCEVLNVACAHILQVHLLRPPEPPATPPPKPTGGDESAWLKSRGRWMKR